MKTAILFLWLMVAGLVNGAILGPAWLSATVTASSGGGGFNPATDSDVKAWYKASSLSLSDNAGVNAWADSTANGNDLAVSGNSIAVFRTSVYGAYSAVATTNMGSSGASSLQRATWAGGSVSQPFTVCAVLIATNNAEYDSYWAAGSADSVLLYLGSPATYFRMYAGTLLSGPAFSTTIHTWVCVYNGASSAMYQDGVSVASGDAGTSAMNGVHLFSNQPHTSFGEMFLFEWFFIARDATSDVAAINTYLKTAYGIP